MKHVALLLLSAAMGLTCVVQSEPAAPRPTPVVPQPQPAEPAEPQPAAAANCREADCAESEYCAFKEPGCDATESACAPRPEMCTREYRPVCGCDEKTYSNACTAAAAGANVAKLGACESEAVTRCGGIVGSVCPAGSTCVDDPNDTCIPGKGGADCIGMCVATPQSTAPTCQPVRCKMFCKDGWKRGPDGCEICSCK